MTIMILVKTLSVLHKDYIMLKNPQCILKMACRKYVIAALVLLAVLHVGSAIQCFQCVEEVGGDGICRDEKGITDASVDCSQSCIEHTFAPISIGKIETGEIITRVCSDPNYCQIGTAFVEKQMGLKTRRCTSCNTNYCNSGSTVIPSFILVAILAVKYYFL